MIDSLKNAAIEQTIKFFGHKRYSDLITNNNLKLPNKNELKRYLDLEHPDLEHQVELFKKRQNFDIDGLKAELKDKMVESLGGLESFNDTYIINTINCYDINGLVKDYCLLNFWYLFNDSQLSEFTNIKKKQLKTSYVWQNNPDKELSELYSLMIGKYKLIASETTYEQFKAVFTGQPIDEIEPIKWLVAKNLNAYFIEQLIENKKLSKAVNKDVWEIAKNCFIDGRNFSQLVDLYNNNKTGKPRTHSLIDNLIIDLKNPL